MARFKTLAYTISNYFSFIPIILAAIAGILALIYKKKAETAEEQVIISHTQAQDAPLASQQAQDEAQIKQVDETLQKLENEREKANKPDKTDKDKAASWNKN